MPHPPYSPDLAPSNYHLLRSLQNHLNGKTFDSNEAVKHDLIKFFASENQTFYKSRIVKLTERWQKNIKKNIPFKMCMHIFRVFIIIYSIGRNFSLTHLRNIITVSFEKIPEFKRWNRRWYFFSSLKTRWAISEQQTSNTSSKIPNLYCKSSLVR